jgi:hypothetical protein
MSSHKCSALPGSRLVTWYIKSMLFFPMQDMESECVLAAFVGDKDVAHLRAASKVGNAAPRLQALPLSVK